MLFGESTDYQTACALMSACVDAGAPFFDTAEMYPVPQRAETSGRSEEYLGRWMQQHSRSGESSQSIAVYHDVSAACCVKRACTVSHVSSMCRRDQILVASKVAGPSGQMTWIRGGPPSLDAANITAAIDGSLQRLQTDYIDLLQLHWPDRSAVALHRTTPCCTGPVALALLLTARPPMLQVCSYVWGRGL